MPFRADLILAAAERRLYHPSFYCDLMTSNAMTVTIHDKGLINLQFWMDRQLTHECSLDTAPRVTCRPTDGNRWVWQNPRPGGVCLIVPHPVDVLEIFGQEWQANPYAEALALVIAGIPPGEIPALMATRIIQKAVIIAQPCHQAKADIQITAAMCQVQSIIVPPGLNSNWAAARDAHVSRRNAVARGALGRVRRAIMQCVVHQRAPGRGIRFSRP